MTHVTHLPSHSPASSSSAVASPGQATPGQATPGQAAPGQATLGQASPGHASSTQPSPGPPSPASLPDPAAMPSEHLEAELVSHAEWEASGTARMLAVLAEFDRRQAWAAWECTSAQHWLSWKCGLGYTAATERLRVARALPALPTIEAALAAGRLSWSKVRELTRVATPDDEANWATIAEAATANQVAKLTSAARTVTGRHAARQLDERAFAWHTEADGSMVLEVRLPADRARQLIDTVRNATPLVAGQRWATSAADTLVHLVTGGGHTPAQVIAHLEPDGATHLDNGPAINPDILDALACDGSVTTLLRYPTGPVQIDLKKSPSAGQRRWLALRHTTCQFPGCNHAGAFEAHHVIDRLKGGPTRLRNLVRLCWFHHRRVHLDQLVLTLHPDRTLTVTRADGSPIDRPIPRITHTPPAPTAPGNIGNWAGDPLHVDDCLIAIGYR